MNLSLVIPCYNEEDVIDLFYNEIIKVMELYTGKYELIFVNDGSKDKTMIKIIDLASNDDAVKYISLSRNFGKESAMLAGMKYAKGEYIGIIDADLQHPPKMVLEMVRALDNGECDIAAARRMSRKGKGRIKKFFSRSFYFIINKLADIKIEDGAQDFRIMKRKVVESIISLTEYHRFSKGIFSWVGFKTKWFEHNDTERPVGKSKWSFRSLLKYAINGIIAFSIVPLRISMIFGIVVSLVGLVHGIQIIISALFFVDATVERTGFASLFSAILLIGGVILICLGITGEYVARIYMEVKNRPIYIIDETNIVKTEIGENKIVGLN